MQTLIDIQKSVYEYLEKVEKNFSSMGGKYQPHAQRLNYDLDKIYGILPTGKLTLVSGTDDETREIFLSWLALRLGYGSKLPVVCAFNCSAVDFVARLIAIESKVPSSHLNSGMIARQDWASITRAAYKVLNSGIIVAPEGYTALNLLVGRTAALAKDGKPGILIANSAADMIGTPEEFNSLAAKYGILAVVPAATNLPRYFSGLALKVYSYPLGENTMGVNVFELMHGAFIDWGKNPQKNDSICVGASTPD